MSMPTFHLLPSALSQLNNLREQSALMYVTDHQERIEQLFRIAESGNFLDSASIVKILSDRTATQGKIAEAIIQSTNGILQSMSNSVNNIAPVQYFETLEVMVENGWCDIDGVGAFPQGVARLDLKPSLLTDDLRPVVIPLLDKLCSYGHIIPEWRVFDFCNFGGEIEYDLSEWKKYLPDLKDKVSKGVLDNDDVYEHLQEYDLLSLFLLENLDLSFTDEDDIEFFSSMYNQAKSLESLIPDLESISEFCTVIEKRLSDLVRSGAYSKTMSVIKWCYSVLQELSKIEISSDEYSEFFSSWQYSECLVPIDYANLLSFNLGLMGVIESEYQRQMEIGESFGCTLPAARIDLTMPCLTVHQKSQHLIEVLFETLKKVDRLEGTPIFSTT